MILTVTPNPSIDRTIALPGTLEVGGVHRVTSTTDQCGGKGVNISRACVGAGVATCAVLPAAADSAYVAFIAFYALCGVLTWAVYLRPGRRLEGV